ncbi:VPA1262 family protein [Ferrimonas kyonanensis]|uniref:VPA1262 family protein n=1 Tax=Ferrimonas kyonanensis TaxID=364763 RepID=UPI000415D8E1|nr:VPA1262 family protein [Ferrimonas kyonanensis]
MTKSQDTLSFKLDSILSDKRIESLFSEKYSCALQLWLLRIEGSEFVDNRVIYGRLLPYNFDNDLWSFSDNDNFKTFGSYRAQVKKINLYVKGTKAKSVIERLCSGDTLRKINETCGLSFGQEKIGDLFGDVKLNSEELIYKPLAYLINQDARPAGTISSPHGGAGGVSSSIIQSNKKELFVVQGNYNANLTAMVIDQLNQDTGFKFEDHDLQRFGEIELMILPSINEQERSLKSARWSNDKNKFHVSLTPTQIRQYTRFQFNFRIENDGQILYSSIKRATQNNDGNYECTFETSTALHSIADSISLDIYGATNDMEDELILCDRWTSHFIRDLNFQLSMVNGSSEFNKFEWLEKTQTPQVSDRVAKVLSINNNFPMRNNVTTRKTDSWVTINRSLREMFDRIHPKRSDGAFFPTLGMSNGEGRLQFTEWFKDLAQTNQDNSITIFDPYFEDAGLALILLSSAPNSDYTIFRTNHQKEGDTTTKGLETLLRACSHNHKRMQQKTINIYGVRDGTLHDRYILMTDGNGLPVKGYHLSNSFQSANKNFPLLITPIPIDVLYKVVEYKNNLLSASKDKVSHLYNSKTCELSPAQPRKRDELFDSDVIGDILSHWLNEPLLKGLKGNELISKLREQNLYQDDFSQSIDPSGLKTFIDATDLSKVDLSIYWGEIGELLSRTVSQCYDVDYFSSNTRFLNSLENILDATFNKVNDESNKHELSVISPSYFHQTLPEFLYSSIAPHHFSLGIKQSLITWGDYFCIQYMWAYVPTSLVKIVEAQAQELNKIFAEKDSMRLSVLGQILREISQTIEFKQTSDFQLKALLSSNNDFLKWLGWCELENQVISSSDLCIIDTLPTHEKCIFIGWLINRHSNIEQDTEIFNELVKELQQHLPKKLDITQLRNTIKSMLGHMKQLSWAEPWISRKVLAPLIECDKVTFGDASQIWHEELINLLELKTFTTSRLFSSTREGELTNIAAWLWTQSSKAHQKKCLKNFERVIRKQQQIIRQPLASSANWSKWDDALKVSLWIWLFAEWCQYYSSVRDEDNSQQLIKLYVSAKELAMVRSDSEWAPSGAGEQSELFLARKWVFEQIESIKSQLIE